MINRIVRTRLFYRITESLVPILTWSIITLPVWLSLFHPALASYFILSFMIYFLYKTLKTVYYAGIAYQLMERAEKINWYKKLVRHREYKNINHYVIITNYKESVKKIEK